MFGEKRQGDEHNNIMSAFENKTEQKKKKITSRTTTGSWAYSIFQLVGKCATSCVMRN